MESAEVLGALMRAIDERRWEDLAQYLAPHFRCRYVHTGESFSRAEWIALNAEYPGFDRLVVQEILGHASAAACRSHVTGINEGRMIHFECATFVRVHEGQITEMTEVWTDVDQVAPAGTRVGT